MTLPQLQELKEIEDKARAEVAAVCDERALESWRITYLGRRSRLNLILRGLVSLPLEEKRQVGAAANRLRSELEEVLSQRQAQLREAALTAVVERGRLDVTLPGRPLAMGRLHPVTQVLRDILAAFVSMGFQVIEGPEVDWDYYNFEAVRIPKDHPARDMWDTLWIDYVRNEEYPMLLRTHTSPMQIRVMEQMQPPVRIVSPGKCYRHEATDPTHEWMLTQVEGLAVDENISMADLKGTLYEFARRLFGRERRVRFRCDYFPFVEPGADMAIDCPLCEGQGCREGRGWREDAPLANLTRKQMQGDAKSPGTQKGPGPRTGANRGEWGI